MIEKKFNNLKDYLTNVHLSSNDKRDVFKRVSLVVDKIEAISSEYHKAPTLSPFSINNTFEKSLFGSRFASNIFVYVKQRKFVPSLVILLLLCATGGVSAIAENALPGDSLYSLKVNVNEQVKGFVAVTPEAKARLAVETTERRLQEAVILSSQGKLTNDRKQIIQDQLSKSTTDVKNNVATLVASNNISIAQEVSINFEASLKTHELILETLTKNADDLLQGTTTVSIDIKNSTSTSSKEDTGTSTNNDVTVTVDQNATTTQKDSQLSSLSTLESKIDYPANTLMQDIRQEIKANAQVREDLSQKEIAEATDPSKISSKITDTKSKYADLVYQRKTLTDLSLASGKLFDSYLDTASSSINDAEVFLNANNLEKATISLQQATKSLSDSDSLISIELNSRPEIRKALDLIDINKLLESIHSDNLIYNSTSTGVISSLTVNKSNGSVLGTTTPSR